MEVGWQGLRRVAQVCHRGPKYPLRTGGPLIRWTRAESSKYLMGSIPSRVEIECSSNLSLLRVEYPLIDQIDMPFN